MAIVANFTTVRPEMAHTRTAKDFYSFLGLKAENLGVAAKLYEKYTTSYFTEALGNVVYNDTAKRNSFLKINSLLFEWENELHQVKHVPFAANVDATFGSTHGVEIPMAFTEKYYEVNDTFMIDESKQMCIVIGTPIRKADDYWEYMVRLMDSDRSAELNVDACQQGMTTRWIGNVQPELHETGCVKHTSNYEKLRGWIGELRSDIDVSQRYLDLEDAFVQVSSTENKGKGTNILYKMPGVKKVLFDTFMQARNNSLLWQKSTMDENGKCLVQDRQGRDLIAGDGAIPQIMKQASKYYYDKFNHNVLSEMMNTMAQKADSPIGNTWAFVVNIKLWNQFQQNLPSFLVDNKVDNQALYSKFENDYIKVGATYNAYEQGGNTIVAHVDTALSEEFPNKGFGVMIDLTADKSSGQGAINMFTLKNKAFIDNYLRGVGGKSGEVATPVAGEKYVISGYAGIGVMVPYRSYVVMEN